MERPGKLVTKKKEKRLVVLVARLSLTAEQAHLLETPFLFLSSSTKNYSDGRRPRQGRGPARRCARAPRLPSSGGSCRSAGGRQEAERSRRRRIFFFLFLFFFLFVPPLRRRRRLLRARWSAPAFFSRRGLAFSRRSGQGARPGPTRSDIQIRGRRRLRPPGARRPSSRRRVESLVGRLLPRRVGHRTPDRRGQESSECEGRRQVSGSGSRGAALGFASRGVLRGDGSHGSLDARLAREGEACRCSKGAGLAGDAQVARVGPRAPLAREVRCSFFFFFDFRFFFNILLSLTQNFS